MAWKDISESTFKIDYADAAKTSPSGEVKVTLQYDDSSESPTSIKVRFKLARKTTYYYDDALYALYNANNNPESKGRTLIRLKPMDAGKDSNGEYKQKNKWPYYSNDFTLTKSYTAATFYLEDIWICNTGAGTVDESSQKVTYKDYSGYFHDVFSSDGKRANYADRGNGSQSLTLLSSTTVATAVTAHEPIISDNYNNTFKITANAGTNGDNNNVRSTTLYYRCGGSDGDSFTRATSLNLTKLSHTASASSKEQTVYAYTKVDGTYGDDPTSDTASLAIKNYVAPTLPKKSPTATSSKSRFTNNSVWTFSWAGADQQSKQVNGSSPVAGYRIVLLYDGESVPIKNSNGTVISKNPSSATWHTIDTVSFDSTNIRTYINIYPAQQGFEPGHKVQVGIRPYILWGAKNPTHNGSSSNDNKLFNETEDAYKYSTEITVENAGVMNIKVGDSWKEGQVYIKINDQWREAESVSIKVSDEWKEAQ